MDQSASQPNPGASGAAEMEAPSPTTCWVLFLIMGPSLHPEQISAELGLDPDRIAFADPATEAPGIWQLNSSLAGDEPLEAHVWNLMERLARVYREVAQLSKQYRLEFFCSVHKTGRAMESVALSPRLMLLIGHIGAHLEFEVSDAEVDEGALSGSGSSAPMPEQELSARLAAVTAELEGQGKPMP